MMSSLAAMLAFGLMTAATVATDSTGAAAVASASDGPIFGVQTEATENVIVVDGTCTLSDAIIAANNDSPVGACPAGSGADTIVLDFDTVLATADTVNSSQLDSDFAGLPDISSEIRIEAGIEDRIERLNALNCDETTTDAFRILNIIAGGDLTLSGVVIRYGCAVHGGGLYFAAGSIGRIEASRFIQNTARAVASDPDTHALGGAIFLAEGSEISSISDTAFENNAANGAELAGVNMSSHASGGAIYEQPGEPSGSVLLIQDSRFDRNGAIAGDNLPGNAGRARGGAAFLVSPQTHLDRVVFLGNLAEGGDSTVLSGGEAYGGAVWVANGLLTDVYLLLNDAQAGDGTRGGDAHGGALATDITGVELHRVTMLRNTAWGGQARTLTGGYAHGGGLWAGTTTLASNVTYSENTAFGGQALERRGGTALGGGAYDFGGNLVTRQSTFVENRVRAGGGQIGPGPTGGGGIWFRRGTATIVGSLFSGNDELTSLGVHTPQDCGAEAGFVSLGYNLVETPDACTFAAIGDRVGLDAEVSDLLEPRCRRTLPGGPLGGGQCLPVHRLLATSPAIDAGSCATSGVFVDARNLSRPWNYPDLPDAADGCDIGAYESRIDEVFGDGFEAGDVSAWSSMIP